MGEITSHLCSRHTNPTPLHSWENLDTQHHWMLHRQLSINQIRRSRYTNWEKCDVTINCRLVGGPSVHSNATLLLTSTWCWSQWPHDSLSMNRNGPQRSQDCIFVSRRGPQGPQDSVVIVWPLLVTVWRPQGPHDHVVMDWPQHQLRLLLLAMSHGPEWPHKRCQRNFA